jgi:hypothetical protein
MYSNAQLWKPRKQVVAEVTVIALIKHFSCKDQEEYQLSINEEN